MADARSIILHEYPASPYAEKVRLTLRLKNLAYARVEQPSIMPKPDLIPLTGGYRRIPVLQIGADIYCDTAIILRELDIRYPMVSLKLPGHEGLSQMVAGWSDGRWFQSSVAVIFGEIGDNVPEAFIKDREQLSGRPFNIPAMKAVAPMMRDQWRARLMLLEERLAGAKGAGGGLYLIGAKPGFVDVHAYMNVWWMKQAVPAFADACFESAPLTRAWYDRLTEVEGQTPETITPAQAIAIAKDAAPRLVAATTRNEPQGFAPGEHVAVAPDDYGQDWVEGELVHADSQRVILQRVSDVAETIHVHFPRAGFLVRRA
ncbi:MAG: glutathione S-transferase [Hyphomonas sp.]|uniref:glutathione S-transferase n=1 Tax=Hyphomonas sp. TaxID=87 RepID=UPI001D92A3F4|nr:glutathione S-transferase [Hyphomonas sp.]MBA4225350.1 glutathione S-transferase [Hyphomonas sp.]